MANMASATHSIDEMPSLGRLKFEGMSITNGTETKLANTDTVDYWVDLISTSLRITHGNRDSETEQEDESTTQNIDEAVLNPLVASLPVVLWLRLSQHSSTRP